MNVTWEQIRSQFTDEDVAHMLQLTNNQLNLGDCQSVKQNASAIFTRVSNGTMPPGRPWPPQWVRNFADWMVAGMPCPAAGSRLAGQAADQTVTWAQIRSQFTDEDIAHMLTVSGGNINLGNCQSVKQNSPAIFARVSNGTMPPGNPWPAQWIRNFADWMTQGSQCPNA